MICPKCASNSSGYNCRHCGTNIKFTYSVGDKRIEIQRAIEKKFAEAHRAVIFDTSWTSDSPETWGLI